MFEHNSKKIAKEGITTFDYTMGPNNTIQISQKNGHTHFYSVDRDGNGTAYPAYHPEEDRIYHEHEIVNWQVLQAHSNCYPECEEEYGYKGLADHSHYLQMMLVQIAPSSGPEFPPGTHRAITKVSLLNAPAVGISTAFVGYLPKGISVQVVREMVNKEYSAIKVVPGSDPTGDPEVNAQIAAFGEPGADKMIFYVRSAFLEPYVSIRDKILKKIYVAPKRMSKLESTLAPNWVNLKEPHFHKGKVEYWVTVKLPYTCTNETIDLQSMEQEAKRKGLKLLFGYYNVDYGENDKTVEDFVNGFLSCAVHDYHLEPRPGAKLKMLVKVRAIYFNWLRQHGPAYRSVEAKHLPTPYKKITLDPARYQEDYAKIALKLSKWDRDMRMQGVELPGNSLTKQGLRVHSFANQLDKFLIANGLPIGGGKQVNYLVEIGFDETMMVSYIVAKPKPRVPLSKPRIAKTLY